MSSIHSNRAKVYVGNIVDTPSLGQLRIRLNHAIQVDDKGFIQGIEPYDEKEWKDAQERIVFLPEWSFLLPTFTDLHLHAPQYLYAGTGLSLPLLPWLTKYAYAAEERLDTPGNEELVKKVYRTLGERLIKEGTGGVLLFGTIRVETNMILAQTFLDLGIRAYIGKLSMDTPTLPLSPTTTRPTYLESSPSTALQSLSHFITQIRNLTSTLPEHDRIIHPVITPRFVPSCSEELLKGLGELYRSELKEGRVVRIQSHMCESWDQVEWVRETRGEEDEDIFERVSDCGPRRKRDVIPWSHGLLTPHTTQAHVTSLSPNLISRLHSHETSIAHCPLSNTYFSDAVFPLREVLDAGVKVGLGSDIAGGYQVGLGNGMRWAVGAGRGRESRRVEAEREIARTKNKGEESTPGKQDAEQAVSIKEEKNLRVDWKETLWMATRGGAEALGLEGRLEVGCPFDAQLIRLVDSSPSTFKSTQSQTEIKPIGLLDFFDLPSSGAPAPQLEEWYLEAVERWWCNGDDRNRVGMWVQGRIILPWADESSN